ncbi:g1624 [Coccomyxa viridis]|uniref:G1624 protein n=1 Tax=Coccomyxa viridis TaxID=1274662 RepID=A0ABP1FNV0_9CHLO
MVGTGALRAAKYLNEAYREFLQKMRIVEDMPRLWENAPETEHFSLGPQADSDLRTTTGIIADSPQSLPRRTLESTDQGPRTDPRTLLSTEERGMPPAVGPWRRTYDPSTWLRSQDEQKAVEARTVRVRDTSSDRRILELGWQDVGTIKSVISGKMPTEALRTAEHLNEAYQDFLQLMRVEDEALGKRPRPWENAPESEEYLKALYLFSTYVDQWGTIKAVSPESPATISTQADIDIALCTGLLPESDWRPPCSTPERGPRTSPPTEERGMPSPRSNGLVKWDPSTMLRSAEEIRRLEALYRRPEPEQAVEARPVRDGHRVTDRRILDLASQDIGVIRSVITDRREPIATLRTAEHLNEAYREYLRSLRVVGNARPWESAPMSEAYLEALYPFSSYVAMYHEIENTPQQGEAHADCSDIVILGDLADADTRKMCGWIPS